MLQCVVISTLSVPNEAATYVLISSVELDWDGRTIGFASTGYVVFD